MSNNNKYLYSFNWPIFASYSYREGYIIPEGDKIREYNPGDYISIPTEFARIVHITAKNKRTDMTKKMVDKLMKFISQFGLLGYTVDNNSPINLGGSLYDADPLNWALDHVYYVDICLQIHKLIKDVDEFEIRKVLKILKQKQDKETYLGIPTLHGYNNIFFDFAKLEKSPISIAETIRETIINNNLGTSGRCIKNGRSIFELNSLIQYIYWIIADASTHERIRTCKECGTVFFAYDERQEFCPAIYTKESPCSKKHRMKRLREK